MSNQKLTTDELEKIFSNPFYAITIDRVLAEEHDPLVSEEQWIEANTKLIKEIGADKWLPQLLDVLKGNYA